MQNLNRKLNDTYTIIEEIGAGGGGVVYKAYHERLKKDVVVKRVKEKVKGIIEGRAEADILKNIKHTYLPTVYDFLEIDGEIYTVMDFIPGESMDKAVRKNGRFAQKQVLVWARQLAEALDYLHRQTPPVVHSDIKPANIMLTPDGNICLIDFNVSLAFDSSARMSTGTSAGYSPPEQYQNVEAYRKSAEAYRRSVSSVNRSAKGKETAARAKNGDLSQAETVVDDAETEVMAQSAETETMAQFVETETMAQSAETEMMAQPTQSGQTETQSIVESMVGRGVDERSDVYSLGATLYHLLTGVKPGTDYEQIVPIDRYDIGLSEGFAHIIKKMMELRPENRYQNGSEVLYAFEHIYDLDSEYRRYKRKRRSLKIAAALLYLAGGALLAGGYQVRQNEKNVSYNRSIESVEAFMESENYEEAARILQDAEALIPSRVEAYSEEAQRLYRMGDYEACIGYAIDVIQNPFYEINSDTDRIYLADIYYVLGNAYLETEEYANAMMNLESAIDNYDENSLYFRDYAIALANVGQIDRGEEALETAVRLNLGEDSIYMAQGEIAYAKGNYEEAEGYLRQAVSATEDGNLRRRAVLLCDKAYRELGTDYLDQEIAFLEQEENRAGGAESAMYLSERLADAYARKAEADEENSREYYQKALERFEFLYDNGYSTFQMMENIAILYQQMNEYEQAEEMLGQMAGRYPDRYECYKRLAFLEADKQQVKDNADRDYGKMKEYYDQAKELYGDQDTDQEMQMLDSLIADLRSGNWL